MEYPYPYPHIPEGAQDREYDTLTGRFASEPFSVQRVVHQTDSQEWGDHASATARSLLEPTVNKENEQLFRTYHPALASAGCVLTTRLRRSQPYIWVVVIEPDTDITPIGSHAGDREIHFRQPYTSPYSVSRIIAPLRGTYRTPINVRRMRTAADLNDIRSSWPGAVGIRILISGLVLVIYDNEYDAIYDMPRCPPSYGDLEVGYILRDHVPAVYESHEATDGRVSLAGTSKGVAEHTVALKAQSSLGLRLRLQNGVEAITVATHEVVPEPKFSLIEHLSNWFNGAMNALSSFIPLIGPWESRPKYNARGTITYRSPLGREVWIPDTNTKIGRIIYTYDEPHPYRAFPAGFKHDISLVVGNLPDRITPCGARKMEWADYQDALDHAGSAFVCRLRSRNETGLARRSPIEPEDFENAVIEGTEYLWDQGALSSSASILWRTIPGTKRTNSLSGCVLCLGKPSDADVKVVAFQSFQYMTGKRHPDGSAFECFKGGFILPEEVRKAEIILPRPRSP